MTSKSHSFGVTQSITHLGQEPIDAKERMRPLGTTEAWDRLVISRFTIFATACSVVKLASAFFAHFGAYHSVSKGANQSWSNLLLATMMMRLRTQTLSTLICSGCVFPTRILCSSSWASEVAAFPIALMYMTFSSGVGCLTRRWVSKSILFPGKHV